PRCCLKMTGCGMVAGGTGAGVRSGLKILGGGAGVGSPMTLRFGGMAMVGGG
nr:hypothetical protein [Leuconostoc sp.]